MDNAARMALSGIRGLIEYEKKRMSRDDGYWSDGPLVYLENSQIQTALRYGVPIGVRGLHDDYHGSHEGEYRYDTASDWNGIQRLQADRSNEDRISVSPFLPDPNKVFGYIVQAIQIESGMEPADRLAMRADEEFKAYREQYLHTSAGHVFENADEIAQMGWLRILCTEDAFDAEPEELAALSEKAKPLSALYVFLSRQETLIALSPFCDILDAYNESLQMKQESGPRLGM